MCGFKDEIKTIVRDYIADFFNAHSFEAHLLMLCVYSKTEHEPQGGEKSERRSSTISTRMRGILLRSRHAVEVA